MIASTWKDAVITFATDDTLTPEVDLERAFEFLTILIPTITSSTVTVHISNDSGGTFYPVYVPDADATGDFAHATTAATTSKAITLRIGGARYIKIKCGSSQGANRTFKVRGFSRDDHIG